MKLRVNNGTMEWEFEDSDEICNKILSDPVYAAAYIQESFPNQNNTENTENIENAENLEEVSFSESSWEHRTVLLFLEECRKHKADLRNPKIRRRTVFLKIKQAMQESGYSFKESSLEKKLANLKTRYNRIVDNNKKTSTGRGRISWSYFDQMALVYEDEVSVRNAPTVSSLNPPASSEPIAGLACVPSSSRTEPKIQKIQGVRAKFVALEEEKVAIAREVLHELKELRLLRERKFQFEVQKYNDQRNRVEQ